MTIAFFYGINKKYTKEYNVCVPFAFARDVREAMFFLSIFFSEKVLNKFQLWIIDEEGLVSTAIKGFRVVFLFFVQFFFLYIISHDFFIFIRLKLSKLQ